MKKILASLVDLKLEWLESGYFSASPVYLCAMVYNKAGVGVFLPVDAKYKNYDDRDDDGDAYDDLARKISTQDIYQTFACAHGFGHGQHAFIPTAIIF